MGLVYEWGDGTVTEICARLLPMVLVVIIAICWKIKQFNQAIKLLVDFAKTQTEEVNPALVAQMEGHASQESQEEEERTVEALLLTQQSTPNVHIHPDAGADAGADATVAAATPAAAPAAPGSHYSDTPLEPAGPPSQPETVERRRSLDLALELHSMFPHLPLATVHAALAKHGMDENLAANALLTAPQFKIGETVELQNLNQTELNGRRGTIVSYDPDRSRYGVKLEGMTEPRDLNFITQTQRFEFHKAENLCRTHASDGSVSEVSPEASSPMKRRRIEK